MCHHKGILRRLISLVAALTVLLSIMQTAAAAELAGSDGQSGPEDQPAEALSPSGSESEARSEDLPEDVEQDVDSAMAEDIEAVLDSQPVPAEETSGEVPENAWSGTPVETNEFGIPTAAEERTSQYTDPSALVQGVAAPTTYQEVYERMIAFKTIYPEGLAWTNYTPYGSSGPLGSAYVWQGGSVKGANSGVGCAAFAFILSDAAFGSLPARTIDNGGFTFDDVKVGDILRINNNSHFVIVLQKSAAGVTVAEANYNSSAHWGRALSEAEVMAANFLVTRYPTNFVPSDSDGADEVVQSGTEESLSWTLTKAGVLTISGNGPIPDYSADSLPGWSSYTISTIVIETGVTAIGDYAFCQCGALAVYIPDSVTSIGEHAFHEAALLSVTIPGSVKTVGNSAFYNCQNITSVTIGSGVTTIEDKAFHGCTALAYIDFPASVTSVGAGAFDSCSQMTRVRFMPGTATVTLADGLFASCHYLTEVILPQSLNRIGENMFSSCLSLYSIYIPAAVTEIGSLAFTNSGLVNGVINYGGTETAWNDMVKIPAQYGLTGGGTINYNVAFNDPFVKDPNDPGDLPGVSGSHTHIWSTDWTSNGSGHWHECAAEDCPVTDDSQKGGYAGHSYGSWVTDMSATASQNGSRHRDCTVCGYRQTESIPATGSSSGGPGSSGGSSGSVSSSGSGSLSGTTSTTTTIKNPDGSTTTIKTNTNTGTVTETTKHLDGSQTVVETQKNGTVTTQETDSAGNKTETIAKPDGSSAVTTTLTDGTVATITTNASGRVEAEVQLPAAVINTAQQSGEAVPLPIAEVQVLRDLTTAPAITVYTKQGGDVKVAIPAVSPTVGTVAVLVHPDGSTEILKTSVATSNSVVVSMPDGATVKIIDNSKRFSDVPDGVWSEDAITFVAARELFTGITENTFAPDSPMTRAMLMTVLARYDGEDTSGGAVWYEKGVDWALAHAISDGSNPNGNITREQLVTMLWRYSGSPTAGGMLNSFIDAGTISEYAQEAMRWAVEKGIISGYGDGRLAPEAHATRAEVAAMIMRYTSIA